MAMGGRHGRSSVLHTRRTLARSLPEGRPGPRGARRPFLRPGARPSMANAVVTLTTSEGTIRAEIFEDMVPATAANFLKLVRSQFYDHGTFHRVIPGFMIQGGDPQGNGTGGPGYTIRDEFHPSLKHSGPGILSMANAGPNTGGSQFFITLAATPWLDGKHAIFGRVIDGQAVVEKIARAPRDRNDRPTTPIQVESIRVA